MDNPRSLKEWRDVGLEHFKLCEKLMNKRDNISESLWDEIKDDVYKYVGWR